MFLSADLGLDEVIAYRLDSDGSFKRVSSVSTPPGTGPCHIAQHPDSRFVYVSNELNSTVSLIQHDGDEMHLGSDLADSASEC